MTATFVCDHLARSYYPKEDDVVEESKSPSEETDQAVELADLVIERLRKSGLPHAAIQYVLEHEGAKVVDVTLADVRHRVEAHIRAIEPHILQRQPFDPVKLLGPGWSVDEQVGMRIGDNLDAGKIVDKDYLRAGEPSINGEERLKRIKAASTDTQLDADDFLALWHDKDHKTLNWLYETMGITWLSFWGTVLHDPRDNRRGVLYIYRNNDGSWLWRYCWIDIDDWNASLPVGVLESD